MLCLVQREENMQKTMRAARMHAVGAPMTIDTIPVPKPGSTDVLVQVQACGMVPNLGNVLANWTKWFPHLPLPKLPAILASTLPGSSLKLASRLLMCGRASGFMSIRFDPAEPARCVAVENATAAGISLSTAISASVRICRKSTTSTRMAASANT